MKTILIPSEQTDLTTSILETALLLANKFDSYIEGFALRFDISALLQLDAVGGAALPTGYWQDDDAAQQARQTFENFMLAHNVRRATGAANEERGGRSFGWREDMPLGESIVGSYGRVFDVIVVGRPDSRSGPRMSTLEAALFDSGRPLLIAPPEPPKVLGEVVTIAWNSSLETARAVAFAMPILKQARRVLVLSAKASVLPGPDGEELARCLAMNDIPVETAEYEGEGALHEGFLAGAQSFGSDLLIKGAYTQSRLRQMIFGGATQHVLANATIPVFMAH